MSPTLISHFALSDHPEIFRQIVRKNKFEIFFPYLPAIHPLLHWSILRYLQSNLTYLLRKIRIVTESNTEKTNKQTVNIRVQACNRVLLLYVHIFLQRPAHSKLRNRKYCWKSKFRDTKTYVKDDLSLTIPYSNFLLYARIIPGWFALDFPRRNRNRQ